MFDESSVSRITPFAPKKIDLQPADVLARKYKDVKQCIQSGRVLKIYGIVEANKGKNQYKLWEKILDDLGTSQPITILISTLGGNSDEVENLDNKIIAMRKKGLVCYTLTNGHCFSVGVRALMIGNPDGVFAIPDSIIQFHGSNSHPGERPNELLDEPRRLRLERLRKTLFPKIAKQTGKDIATIERDSLLNREFTPEEALEYKLIDGIYIDLPNY